MSGFEPFFAQQIEGGVSYGYGCLLFGVCLLPGLSIDKRLPAKSLPAQSKRYFGLFTSQSERLE